MKYRNLLMSFVAIFLLVSEVWGQERCPAGSSGCTIDNAGDRIGDRVREGVDAVSEADTARERAREAGDTVRDCVDCGMDAIGGAFDRIDVNPDD